MSHDNTRDSANPRFQYFDQRQLDLQAELCHPAHAALRETLAQHDDITVQLAALATELEIILDGAYDQNDLCRMLCEQLKKRRLGIDRSMIEIPQ